MAVKKIRQSLRRLTVDYIDLPKDVVMDLPRITVIGYYQIYIENYKNVVQFTDQSLHLRLTNKEIKIIGNNLTIRKIWSDEILVEGIIQEIHFIG